MGTARRYLTNSPRPDTVRPAAHRGYVAVDFGTSSCAAALLDLQYRFEEEAPLSRHRADQLRESVTRFLSRGPQLRLRPEFRKLIAGIAETALPDIADAGTSDDELWSALRTALSEDESAKQQLLFSFLLLLERARSQCSAGLRSWLADVLSDAYNRSWTVPPLDRLGLFEVRLDEHEGKVIESKATVTLSGQPKVQVGRHRTGLDDDEGRQESLIYAGLKQRISQAERCPELGSRFTSDDIIRESLRDVIGRCNSFIANGPAKLDKGRIDNVMIVAPTIAPPAVRQKLCRLIEDLDITLVDSRFDEATAVAMFTLLRDIGDDYDFGLDLLRDRSRKISPDGWEQNILVIDVGGGTTDIALLRLHIHDETPRDLDDHGGHGRYYLLLPEMLGATGRPQLGGEIISLRVFYWIKAMVADRLLRLFPESFGPARTALRRLPGGRRRDGPLLGLTRGRLPRWDNADGKDAFDVLDEIVPTRSASGHRHPSEPFWRLWTIADHVKLDFFSADPPEEIQLSAVDIRWLVQTAEWPETAAPDLRSMPDDAFTITLAREEFEALVTGDIDDAMNLAYQLAASVRGAGTSLQIDQVILSGQASQPPLVRERLRAVFARRPAEGPSFSWHPAAVTVLGDHAKLATSLGACWAKSVQELTRSPLGEVARLREGHNVFNIVMDKFFSLPCTFLKATVFDHRDQDQEILRMGIRMYQAYPDQDLAVVRSDTFELTNVVAIFRDQPGGEMIPQWADFQWELMASRYRFTPDAGVWPHRIQARLEATSQLDLFLLLSLGSAHYRVSGQADLTLDVATWAEPGRITASPSSDDEDLGKEAIFMTGAQPSLAAQLTNAWFPETFHLLTPGEDREPLRGAISIPLPRPSARGWDFYYRDEDGEARPIGTIVPPPRAGHLPVRYFASLDERGGLRVHAGEVPYWRAASPADVQAYHGRVFRVPMTSTYTDYYQPAHDPFSGGH